MLRLIVHYGIHFLVPVLIGLFFLKKNKALGITILLAGIAIDLDHLFANPIFDPDRCSIGFHPLHSYWAIAIYLVLLFIKKTRIYGIALVIHIIADIMDCLLLSFET
ncbi:MAG: DUF6122 family protein [Bacteroidota bacterium]